MKEFLLFIACVILLLATIFVFQAFSLFSLKFWGVQYEDARTDIFEKTKSYKHGTIRDIENLCLDALKAETQTHKDAIKSVINHRIATFDGELPSDVTNCLNQI